MVERRLQAAQSLSGLVFAAFLLLHLLHQMSAVLGAAAYDRVQAQLRTGYQVPIVEVALILLPLSVHIALGTAAMVRAKRAPPRVLALPARLHRWSGRFLLFVVTGHVAATRLPALLDGVAPDFAGVAFTFHWVPLWFWPYYALLALTGWYHLLYGLAFALPQLGLRHAAPGALRTAFVVGAAALLAAIISFGTTNDAVMQSEAARWWLARFRGSFAQSRCDVTKGSAISSWTGPWPCFGAARGKTHEQSAGSSR